MESSSRVFSHHSFIRQRSLRRIWVVQIRYICHCRCQKLCSWRRSLPDVGSYHSSLHLPHPLHLLTGGGCVLVWVELSSTITNIFQQVESLGSKPLRILFLFLRVSECCSQFASNCLTWKWKIKSIGWIPVLSEEHSYMYFEGYVFPRTLQLVFQETGAARVSSTIYRIHD